MNRTNFFKRLQELKEGSNYYFYNNKKYLVIKNILLNKKLIKIYAKELGGNDIVSGNYYVTIKDGLLKPCEMSDKKVIYFVLNITIS